MQLIIGQTIERYDVNLESINRIIERMNQFITDENVVFSHLVVDGKEVYEEPYDYFTEHLTKIKVVELITFTQRQYAESMLVSLNDYVVRASPELKVLSEKFYLSADEESWAQLGHSLEGLQWILMAIGVIEGSTEIGGKDQLIEVGSQLAEVLGQFDEAVGTQDLMLIADLLQYELIPLYEKVRMSSQSIIDQEVVRNDIH